MFGDTASQTFFWILLASVLFFAVSFAFGMDSGGDADSGSIGGDGHVDGGHALSWNVLSLRNLFLFGIGFGAVGFLSIQSGYSVFTSVCGAIASGGVIVALGVWFFRLISQQESNTLTDHMMLLGHEATVTTAIPATGQGEILTINEHGVRVSLSAQSDGVPISSGAKVVILSVAGGRAIVRTA